MAEGDRQEDYRAALLFTLGYLSATIAKHEGIENFTQENHPMIAEFMRLAGADPDRYMRRTAKEG